MTAEESEIKKIAKLEKLSKRHDFQEELDMINDKENEVAEEDRKAL